MKYGLSLLFVVGGVCLITVAGWADIIKMQTGETIEGKFLGATEDLIYFQTVQGVVEHPIANVLSIMFLPLSKELPKAAAPVKKPSWLERTPTPQPQIFTLAPNTRLSIRVLGSLNNGANRKNDWFTAALDGNVMINGVVVIPKGARIRGQVIKSEQGKTSSGVTITLRTLLLKTQEIPIETTSYGKWFRPRENQEFDPAQDLQKGRFLEIPDQSLIDFKLIRPVEIEIAP